MHAILLLHLHVLLLLLPRHTLHPCTAFDKHVITSVQDTDHSKGSVIRAVESMGLTTGQHIP